MKRISYSPWGYVYILPVLFFALFYLLYPAGFVGFHSFFDWNGISAEKDFIGLGNFFRAITDPVVLIAVRNFILFTVLTVGLQAFFGCILAGMMIIMKLKGTDIHRTVIFAPAVLTPVVVGTVFFRILEPNLGFAAQLLRSAGFSEGVYPFLADPSFALLTIAAVNIWQWTGFSMTLYYANMSVISPDVYESARVDGAGFWRILFQISFPMLSGTTSMLFVLGSISSLKHFDLVYTMTRGGPANSTEFFSTYIFRTSMQNFEQGYASAISVIMFCIALIITLFYIFAYERRRNV